MRPKSVLFYTYALTGGGAERVWALLASGFAARGWDVTLAVDFDASENFAFLDPRVHVTVLGRGHAGATVKLARLLAATKPDVSISAMSASNLKHAAAAALAGRLSRAVLSFHGYSTTEPRPLSKIGYLAIPALTRATAATICVSDGMARHIIKQWRGDPKKTVRIYNPVQIGSREKEGRTQEPRERPSLVLASGRLIFYKNFSLLLRAFARVEPAAARLCLIGEGPERQALESEIARLGLEGRVEMPGYATQPWSWYERASCFVSSSDKEPFGLVVVEALAYGLPIVSTACDGPSEILADGLFGDLVAPGDEIALAQAISKALASPGDPRPRIERAGEFSLERALNGYESLFEEVIARSEYGAPAPSLASRLDRPLPAVPSRSERSGSVPTPDRAQPKRKVVFYTHALAGGGAERVWALLASAFTRAGYNVTLVVDFQADANQMYVDRAVRLVVLGGGHFENVARLSALIKEEAPDAVLSALCISNLKATAAAARAGALDRLLLSYHGFFGSESQPLSVFSYLLTPLLTRMTGATVAVSDSLRRHLTERWRGDPRRIVRIYNPINREGEPQPSAADLAARPPAILAVGRLEKHKKFDVLLRAFARVQPPNATLTIMGEGSQRDSLIALINDLGVGDRVRLVGYQIEPWSFYAQAKCLAVSSKSEAFGLVVSEALAHGLAVVSTDCHGPREILADGQYGRLVPIDDPGELARSLSLALADPGDPGPRIARARQFSIDKALAEYGALIEERVAARRMKPGSPAALAPGDRGA